jgi:hypothetical protein
MLANVILLLQDSTEPQTEFLADCSFGKPVVTPTDKASKCVCVSYCLLRRSKMKPNPIAAYSYVVQCKVTHVLVQLMSFFHICI